MWKSSQWYNGWPCRVCMAALSIILIPACTSVPTVHVFPHYLSENEKQSLVSKLSASKFVVQVSEQLPPLDITQNSIVYTPMTNSEGTLKELMFVLANAGYDVSSANLIFSGNHSFSENNLGVYLFPANFVAPVQEYSIPFESEYMGDDCKHSNTLTVMENRQFTLLVEKWNAATERYDETTYKGFWSRDNVDTLQLRFESSTWLNFKRTMRVETDANGSRKRVKLSPISHAGNFEMKNVQCSYSISLVL